MGTVTIAGTVHTIYNTTVTALAYANAMVGAQATAWLATTAANQAKSLVSARRVLDKQLWQGTKTVAGQTLQWPRTDVTDQYGDEVDDSTPPQQILDAEVELAVLYHANATAQSETGDQNVKYMKAGPVELEFFRSQSGGTFPRVIQDLVGQFLSGGLLSMADIGLSISGGEDVESEFDTSDVYTVTRGL